MSISQAESSEDTILDTLVVRRIKLIWVLLYFNAMPAIGEPLVHVPHFVLQLLPAGALALAALLALNINRRLSIRPNFILGLYTVLVVIALMTAIRVTGQLGAISRTGRLAAFLGVLWLLTPWWGRRDMLLLRCHIQAVLIVLASILVGLLVAPSRALGGGRLAGVVWPIPPTQVGQYAAIACGCTLVAWMSHTMAGKYAFPVAGVGVAFIVLSHTRTAPLALAVGVLVAAVSLILARRRVRRVFTTLLLVAPLVLFVAAPAVAIWFHRGQSASEFSDLTGRKATWASVLDEPRSEFERLFGFGLSNESSNGHSIDDTWLAVYKDEGLVGDAIIGGILLFMLIAPNFRMPGPERAIALFLLGYCAVATYTEVTLGDVTPYLLHLVVAASLVLPALRSSPPTSEPASELR